MFFVQENNLHFASGGKGGGNIWFPLVGLIKEYLPNFLLSSMLRDAQRSPGNAQRRFRKKEELPIPIVADDPLTGRLRACERVSVCIWIDPRWGVVERKKNGSISLIKLCLTSLSKGGYNGGVVEKGGIRSTGKGSLIKNAVSW